MNDINAKNATYELIEVNTRLIQKGDSFITPSTRLPYRVLSIAVGNDGKRKWYQANGQWCFDAICLWLDTNVTFKQQFRDGIILTLTETRN